MPEAESGIIALYGDSSRMKMVDFFMTFPKNDFTVPELVEGIGMSRTTAFKEIDKLLTNDMIIRSGNVGKSPTYKINLRNPVIQLMQNAAHITSDRIAEQQVARKNVNRIVRNARVSSRKVLLMRQQLLEQELQYTRTELEAIPTQ